MDVTVLAQALPDVMKAPPATWFQSGASVAAILGAFEFAKWSLGKKNGKRCATNVDPKLCQEHIKKLAKLETSTEHLEKGQDLLNKKMDLVLMEIRKG